MGLDQHAVLRTATGDDEELQCWRKHPNLQGWMESLWDEKGRPNSLGGEFNCVDLELTLDDIDRLEEDVRGSGLPPTEGFFFGEDSDEDYRQTDLEFCNKARHALENGAKVIYSSWW